MRAAGWRAAAGYPAVLTQTVNPTSGVIGRVLRTSQPELVLDPAHDPDFVTATPEVCAQVCVPIMADGQILGVLSAESLTPGQFGLRDLELLGLLARQLAATLQNARLYRTAQEELAERTRAEAALQDREERLELIARATNDTIWDWDFRADIIRWNEGVHTAFGYAPEAVDHTPDWWPSASILMSSSGLPRAFGPQLESGETSWSAEYGFRRADGSYAYVYDRAHMLQGAGGGWSEVLSGLKTLLETGQQLPFQSGPTQE